MRDDDDSQPMEAEEGEDDLVRAAALLDFDGLSRQHKATGGEAEREKLDEEFVNDIEEQQATLMKVLPNLKAGDQYQEAKVCEKPAVWEGKLIKTKNAAVPISVDEDKV